MPEAKRVFWNSLTENESSADLLANYGNKKKVDELAMEY